MHVQHAGEQDPQVPRGPPPRGQEYGGERAAPAGLPEGSVSVYVGGGGGGVGVCVCVCCVWLLMWVCVGVFTCVCVRVCVSDDSILSIFVFALL